jgi:hypothetical protein
MGTVDLSRAAFEPTKRYAGVRMQQGRVNLDDDFNEAARIADDDEQRMLVHIIGPAGSPDGGFAVSDPTMTGAALDFAIGAGTMYLGGLRVWNPQAARFVMQPDWLLQPASEQALPDEGRTDLVYLEVWKQPVTAVEDAELFEVALAGPDTAARMRTMWRVHLAPKVAAGDCPSAWAAFIAAWKAAALGDVAGSGESVVDATLAVGIVPGGPSDDLCSPPVAGGYLGAENQAIRVELVDATHFTWGFDNASPLYRVQIGADRTTITLETEPKDQAHWPTAGQIVEILPWSAVLPNGEKLAEVSGQLSRVQGSYNPELRTLVLQSAVPAGFGEEWTSRGDAGALAPALADRHYYMRVWNRGDDTASPVEIPFVPGTAVPLGATGLEVTFTGTQFVRGDHWIIAARPETPDELVPWSFATGRRPHGVRRYFTPLALVRWHRAGTGLTWELLHDCRRVFPPLTRLQTCCTYTVGDEQESFGRFKSIQAAVDALPPEGGKVCVLPGRWQEQVTIRNRRNVVIEGCGPRSRLFAPRGDDTCGILISGSQAVTIRSLLIDGGLRSAVVIWDDRGPTPLGAPPDDPGPLGGVVGGAGGAASEEKPVPLSTRILLEQLLLLASARPAVAAFGGSFITLCDSAIEHGPLLEAVGKGDAGRWPAVYMLADDVRIECNTIRGLAARDEPLTSVGLPTFRTMAMGGIQIGGGSERVLIRRNVIAGGNGDGITLGSWAWVPTKLFDLPWERLILIWKLTATGFGIVVNEDGCIEIVWDPPPPAGDPDNPMVPVSMGDLRDIRIVDNAITGMGRAGIGVARWWPLDGRDVMIRVERLTIETNRIAECLRLEIPELPPSLREAAAAGAIALADAETVVIRDNLIERNGRTHVDPVCGVFFLRVAGLSVERNRILDNAPRVVTQQGPRPGFRGGVFVLQALPPSTEVTVREVQTLRASGVPALRVAGNVITVPEGRCLVLIGQGTMAVTDNQLTSRGVGTANRGFEGAANLAGISGVLDVLGGCTVFALNLGRTNELGGQIATLQGMKDVEVAPRPGLDATEPVLAGGDTLLGHNQISLDLLEAGVVSVGSSVVVASIGDDVELDGNQMQIEQDRDIVSIHALVAGWSTRFTGNRCEETLIAANNVTAGLSAFVFGPMAVVTSNVTTHCILVIAALRAVADNVALIQAFKKAACAGAEAAGAAFSQRFMGS